MRIKEIYDYQRDYIQELNKAAKQIHPKLLSRLSYKDFFNDEFDDDTLHEKYNTIIAPMVKIYRETVVDMCQTYLLEYIGDMSILFGTIGYNLEDGVELFETDVSENIFSMSYLPSPEIAPVWDEVQSELMVAYNPTPFWQVGSYWASGDDEKIYIESRRLPSAFIRDHREKIGKFYGHGVLENVVRDVAIYNSFDYPIHVIPLTTAEERACPQNLHDSVQRHLILQYVMENMVGTDRMNSGAWASKISYDGKVTILEETGY